MCTALIRLFRIVRLIYRILNQGSIGRDGSLHGIQCHPSRRLIIAGTALSDLAFQSVSLSGESFDLLQMLRKRGFSGTTQYQIGSFAVISVSLSSKARSSAFERLRKPSRLFAKASRMRPLRCSSMVAAKLRESSF